MTGEKNKKKEEEKGADGDDGDDDGNDDKSVHDRSAPVQNSLSHARERRRFV